MCQCHSPCCSAGHCDQAPIFPEAPLCLCLPFPGCLARLWPDNSDSFTTPLNRLLVHAPDFFLLSCTPVDLPAHCNPNQPSLCEMNSMSMETASESSMALRQYPGSPAELLFWIPSALAVGVGLSNRPEPLFSGDF